MAWLASITTIYLLTTLVSADEATSRLCTWTQPRAGVVRDVLYLDGGLQQYCMWDGSAWVRNTQMTSPEQANGLLYTLDFNRTHKADANFTDIFDGLAATGGQNDNPPYISGTMFADDYEFYTFGGLLNGLDGRDLLNGQLFEPDANTPKDIPGMNFVPNFNSHYEPNNPEPITRNVTHGAGANAPDLHLGFYFSGVHSPSGNALVAFGREKATVTQDYLLKVNMTPIGNAQWYEKPLPAHVGGRGGAGLAWIPVSTQGLLVAIGGAPYPMDAYGAGYFNTTMTLNNTARGPEFMKSVSVYDVGNDTWYTQRTSGNVPRQLSSFCTVVTHEVDPTSYQIYLYGGYNDTTLLYGNITTDVYILSVPSFHWTRVSPPRSDPMGGRWGHVCVNPYPDQMMVIGGQGGFSDQKLSQGRIIEFLNLTSLTWQEEYNPRVWNNYTIPQAVKDTADPSITAENMTATLASLFSSRYPSPIKTWYPYKPASNGGSNIIGPAVGGSVGGVGLVGIVFALWFCRRKRQRKINRQSQMSTATSKTLQGSDNMIDEWVQNQHKQSVSGIAMEVDGSERSILRSLSQEVVEIGGGRPLRIASPLTSSSPQSPQTIPSSSVEVSGEPKHLEELPDTSQRHRTVSEVGSANYNIRDHPLYPRGPGDGLSTADATESDIQPLGIITPDFSSAAPSPPAERRDFYDHVYLGGAVLPSKEPILGSPSQRKIESYFNTKNRGNGVPGYDGGALPLPHAGTSQTHTQSTSLRPDAPRHDSNANSELVLSPLSEDNTSPSAQHVLRGAGMGVSHPFAATRPAHRRNQSSMSSGVHIIEENSPALPSPTADEEHRQSTFIENLPENPRSSSIRRPSSQRKDDH